MKKYLTILFCACTVISCAQTSKNDSSNNIITKKTPEHQNIPGTRVFIIPPNGFTVSTTLPAFQKSDRGLFQAIDLVGGNFYKNTASFSRANFEQKGIKVFEYKAFKINNYPAKMVFMQSDAQAKIYNLVFGDSTFSTSIMGVFAIGDSQTEEQIKQAIQSIYYDKTFEVNPFATALFKLDDAKSIFKFTKFTASTYLYSISGVKKDAYENEPFFMAVAVPTEGATLKSIADEMANAIKKDSIKNVSENKTNGLQSLKREIYGKLKGENSVLYQHIVLIGETAIVMQGIANNDFEKYIGEFEKLSNTVDKK